MPLRDPGPRVTSARHYGPAAPPHRPPRSVSAVASISTTSIRKPPEPLRRAVADCLSPPAPHTPRATCCSRLGGGRGFPNAPGNVSLSLPLLSTPIFVCYSSISLPFLNAAASACQDYIANPSTIDMAYNVLIDHALAESDRSEQQPLRLNPAEISEVIAEVCSESTSNANPSIAPSRLTTQNRQPSADVAFSVLIKLVIDMYMMDSKTAAPLTLYMLEGMLSSKKSSARTKALDLILNLGVHAHLLEPVVVEDALLIDKGETMNQSYLSNEYGSNIDEPRAPEPEEEQKISPAIDQFESWILEILYEVLLLLVQLLELMTHFRFLHKSSRVGGEILVVVHKYAIRGAYELD
ncbi:hypothetical protein PR202_gb03595 [Eleusine coracana subsp. coracana]|uniref:Uncharacterized protein n=1 Tax=Eleusine coracana subsp. coracana TaxID=191504 RepID=A0AAV5E1L7_ELECO|nr:hypothetical protein PR202_gb03595 [Eleusine coracana subsp. coracana]